MATGVERARWSAWASRSSTQLSQARSALRRHTPLISRQRERLHALAAVFRPRPFSSATASISASENLRSPGFRKPQVIEWPENMPTNKATFIGTIVRDLQIQYLDSGMIVANSSIKVSRAMKNHSWFYLEFWGDLAGVAAAHLKVGDMIFVSGSVWPEKVKGRDGLEKIFAKVVVKDLNFVLEFQSAERAASVQDLKLYELWNDLFDNPSDWIDVRGKKITDRHPDFKHKFAQISLWLNNKHTPDWVMERLKKGSPKSPDFNSRLLGKSSLVD